MPSKKKIVKKVAEKKVAEKKIRPPKQVFIAYDVGSGDPMSVHPSKKVANSNKYSQDKVAGPYVLVERVRNK